MVWGLDQRSCKIAFWSTQLLGHFEKSISYLLFVRKEKCKACVRPLERAAWAPNEL